MSPPSIISPTHSFSMPPPLPPFKRTLHSLSPFISLCRGGKWEADRRGGQRAAEREKPTYPNPLTQRGNSASYNEPIPDEISVTRHVQFVPFNQCALLSSILTTALLLFAECHHLSWFSSDWILLQFFPTSAEEDDGLFVAVHRGKIFYEQYRPMVLDISPKGPQAGIPSPRLLRNPSGDLSVSRWIEINDDIRFPLICRCRFLAICYFNLLCCLPIFVNLDIDHINYIIFVRSLFGLLDLLAVLLCTLISLTE